MNPSNHSSLSSPPQSTAPSDIFPFDLDYNSDENNHQVNAGSFDDEIGATLPTDNAFEIILTNNNSEFQDEKLKIIAEPRPMYRGRYKSEIDAEKSRANRYIRTEDGTPKYDHPTIKVSH